MGKDFLYQYRDTHPLSSDRMWVFLDNELSEKTSENPKPLIYEEAVYTFERKHGDGHSINIT